MHPEGYVAAGYFYQEAAISAQNLHRWFLVLWINLFTATCGLAVFWRLTADQVTLARVLPPWVSKENWLQIGLALHIVVIALLLVNIVCCVRMRADRAAARKYPSVRRGIA
jgi:hypothetical protein